MCHGNKATVEQFYTHYKVCEELRNNPHHTKDALFAALKAAELRHATAFDAAVQRLNLPLDATGRLPKKIQHIWCTDWTNTEIVSEFERIQMELGEADFLLLLEYVNSLAYSISLCMFIHSRRSAHPCCVIVMLVRSGPLGKR